MPETIIAGVDIRRPDDMRDCLALATRIAQLADAELLAISVLTPSPSLDVARCERELRQIVETTTSEAGGALAFSVRADPARSPGRSLYEFSERTHAAAVVIGPSLRDADGRWMPGSVAESLLHGGRWPVVVAPDRFAERSNTALRIIGAGFEETAEAREALRHAARLAESAHADLRVIAVVEPFLFSHIGMGHEHEGLEVEHALRQRTKSSLDAAMAALPAGIHCEPVLIDGATVPALTRLSGGLDLLVLGSRGYGAEGAVLLGPVSRELVRNAQCPLMITPRLPATKPTEDLSVSAAVA